jgi:hypothetical protein
MILLLALSAVPSAQAAPRPVQLHPPDVRLTVTSNAVVAGQFRAVWHGTAGCSRYDRWTTTFAAHLAIDKTGSFAGRLTTTTHETITISGRVGGGRAVGRLDGHFVQPNPLDYINCTTGRVAYTASLIRAGRAT